MITFRRNKTRSNEVYKPIDVSDRASFYQYDNLNCEKFIVLIDEEIGIPIDRIDLSIYGIDNIARQPVNGLEELIHLTTYYLKNNYNVSVIISKGNDFCIKFMESVRKST